jgi:ABC-type uncharacterized transport system permease subunit
MDWIDLAQDTDKWLGVVQTVMYIRVIQIYRNSLTRWGTASFTRTIRRKVGLRRLLWTALWFYQYTRRHVVTRSRVAVFSVLFILLSLDFFKIWDWMLDVTSVNGFRQRAESVSQMCYRAFPNFQFVACTRDIRTDRQQVAGGD